jgi:DNA mismatch repair protein MutS
MAGKSTYIRQVALCVLLAQAGSFVPAREARIGVCDRVFARIGAADDLARGASTFMVEMAEIANVLRNATERSLVVLDEVGRGTSTFDGLAVAWAVVEDLAVRIGARTLAATHYHQLTEIAARLPSIRNLHVSAREWGEEVVFLHRIEEGRAEKSFGVHVARLAGVPDPVVERAREILRSLEASALAPPEPHASRRPGSTADTGARGTGESRVGDEADGLRSRPASRRASAARQLTLFEPGPFLAAKKLRDLDLDKTTPLEAHRLLEELRRLVGESPG